MQDRPKLRDYHAGVNEAVFPYPMDAPAGHPKQFLDGFVSESVVGDFGYPVTPSRFRQAAMPSATVPETTIHEDGETLAMEDEVGFAG